MWRRGSGCRSRPGSCRGVANGAPAAVIADRAHVLPAAVAHAVAYMAGQMRQLALVVLSEDSPLPGALQAAWEMGRELGAEIALALAMVLAAAGGGREMGRHHP